MAAVAAEYDGRVEILGMAGQGGIEEMRSFVTDTGTGGLTHVVDTDGELWQRFSVVATPAFAFVEADGTVRTVPATMDADALRRAADDLLAG